MTRLKPSNEKLLNFDGIYRVCLPAGKNYADEH
jgi:hypothetical protein